MCEFTSGNCIAPASSTSASVPWTGPSCDANAEIRFGSWALHLFTCAELGQPLFGSRLPSNSPSMAGSMVLTDPALGPEYVSVTSIIRCRNLTEGRCAGKCAIVRDQTGTFCPWSGRTGRRCTGCTGRTGRGPYVPALLRTIWCNSKEQQLPDWSCFLAPLGPLVNGFAAWSGISNLRPDLRSRQDTVASPCSLSLPACLLLITRASSLCRTVSPW